jgi:hypothetical protein
MKTTEFHEKMSKLHSENLEAFEKEVVRLIEELITSAPGHLQLKLRLVQSRINKALSKCGKENRLATMQGMFWDQFLNEFAPLMKEFQKCFKDK